MTKQLAAELAPRVRVNALAVGAVETAALRPFLNDEIRGQMEALTPMRAHRDGGGRRARRALALLARGRAG